MAQKFQAELGLDTSSFIEGLKNGDNALGKIGKTVGLLTVGFGAAAGALKVLKDWFLQTEQGINTMNSAMYVSHQLLTDIIMKQNFSLRETLDLAKRENDIRENNRIDLMKEAQLNRDIRQYRIDAHDDAKTLEERIQAQNKAIEKQRELESYIKADLQEELKLVNDKLEKDITNNKLRERQAQLVAAIYNADASESLRMISYLNSLEKQLRDNKQATADYITEIEAMGKAQADLESVLKGVSQVSLNTPRLAVPKGAGKISGEPQMNWNLRQVTEELEIQTAAVASLNETFAIMFDSVGKGFDNMITSVIKSIGRMVAELLAKAAVLTLLRILFPASLGVQATTGLMKMFGQGMFSGGGMAPAVQSAPIKVIGSISGKDLSLSLRRNT